MKKAIALVALLAATSTLAAPPPTTYTARVKIVSGGKTTLVPVAEITRDASGAVTTKVLPTPKLDAYTDDFVKRWSSFKAPTKIRVTTSLPEHTGMQPRYVDHTYDFTAKDVLYNAAVVKTCFEKYGYDLGDFIRVQFVEHDNTAEYPPGADDRASTLINFRKGTHLDYYGGQFSFRVKAHVRPTTSPGKGRTSASQPDMSLAIGYDEGLLDVGTLTVFEDGHIEAKPVYMRDTFASDFGTFSATEDIVVHTIHNDTYETWKNRTIPKTSPQLLEAYVIEHLEYYHPYDVSPAIDPEALR